MRGGDAVRRGCAAHPTGALGVAAVFARRGALVAGMPHPVHDLSTDEPPLPIELEIGNLFVTDCSTTTNKNLSL